MTRFASLRCSAVATPPFRSALLAVALAAAGLTPAAAQSGGAPMQVRAAERVVGTDSTLAAVLTRDGGMRVALTPRALLLGFTVAGDRRIRRDAERTFAERASTARVAPRVTDVPTLPADDLHFAKPAKPIPLGTLRQVRASGDSLVFCFVGRTPGDEPCGQWRRIVVTDVPPAEARRFAAAVERARSEVRGGAR